MKYLFIIFFIIISNCTFNKVQKNHGVLLLDKKYAKIVNKETNKNDLLEILGPPSTKSTFNENIWIYIETQKTNQSIFKFGARKTKKNNILIVMLDEKGVVKGKDLTNIEDMNKIKFSKKITYKELSNKNILSDLLTSIKQRMNAPAKKRKR